MGEVIFENDPVRGLRMTVVSPSGDRTTTSSLLNLDASLPYFQQQGYSIRYIAANGVEKPLPHWIAQHLLPPKRTA